MNKPVKVPVYKEEDILKAIEDEGLVSDAWGKKTPRCIWIYNDAMEKEEVWDKFHSPMRGWERSHYDSNALESVTYFIVEPYGISTPEINQKTIEWEQGVYFKNLK